MFKVSQNADEKLFWAVIVGWAPASKPGANRVRFEFDVQFRLLDTKADQTDAIDWEWFVERVADWKRVTDDDGQPLPFSETTLRAVYDMQWSRLPMIQAYYAEVNGTAQRRKN